MSLRRWVYEHRLGMTKLCAHCKFVLLGVNIQPGPMNIMIPFTGVTGILTYAWPFAKTKASLLALTVLYG